MLHYQDTMSLEEFRAELRSAAGAVSYQPVDSILADAAAIMQMEMEVE